VLMALENLFRYLEFTHIHQILSFPSISAEDDIRSKSCCYGNH